MQMEHDPTRISRHAVIMSWLRRIGVESEEAIFMSHGIDDFFTLPFLHLEVLQRMGISADNCSIVMAEVLRLRELKSTEFVSCWLQCLGYEKYIDAFLRYDVSISALRYISEDTLQNPLGVSEDDRGPLFEHIEYFHYFSSAEAAFWWLRSRGFAKYSFAFARNNIPFYALPLVNFFVVDLMSTTCNIVTKKDKLLFTALQQLRTSPCYQVKAIAYWLRDLSLEGYSLEFARKMFLSFDQLVRLTPDAIGSLVNDAGDQERLKQAMAEIKENELFYVAVDAVLSHLSMEKYSAKFALHSISIDVLHLLTDGYLQDMGIVDSEDRKKILDGIRHLNNDLFAAVRSKALEDERPIEDLLAYIGSDSPSSKPNSRSTSGTTSAAATRRAQRKKTAAAASAAAASAKAHSTSSGKHSSASSPVGSPGVQGMLSSVGPGAPLGVGIQVPSVASGASIQQHLQAAMMERRAFMGNSGMLAGEMMQPPPRDMAAFVGVNRGIGGAGMGGGIGPGLGDGGIFSLPMQTSDMPPSSLMQQMYGAAASAGFASGGGSGGGGGEMMMIGGGKMGLSGAQQGYYAIQPPPSNAIAEALVYDLRSGTGSLFADHLKIRHSGEHPLLASLTHRSGITLTTAPAAHGASVNTAASAAGPAVTTTSTTTGATAAAATAATAAVGGTDSDKKKKRKKKRKTKKPGTGTASEATTTTPYDSTGHVAASYSISPTIAKLITPLDGTRLQQEQPVAQHPPLQPAPVPPQLDSGEESDTSSSGAGDDDDGYADDDLFFQQDDGITAEMRAKLDEEVREFEKTLYYQTTAVTGTGTRAKIGVPLPHFSAIATRKGAR
eukprot:TRINITY_DN1103_c0_g4_i1.p1 TRINITY_DN1103_c0_g4~~TRINITY_DN1103_c0_g4_i1.p1  ORF type:complete len:835 (+),score=186.29 TRINITY_DN1103_c0_g4_i1:53-2557(+)